ncbi:hypothetical protein FHS85_002369 [Rhodoligotrophos appendicifer]|uniref:cupin domain-containing protein n=1 Tax=Rhodoligotrophos appendicifer TaxID=987056 RepID=UPI00118679BC|nr:cupin domain-containing protein [Rhodoligotrophos appendicifer]
MPPIQQSAEEVISTLNLVPHPEGGYYTETWRAPAQGGARAAGTAIYFLLKAGQLNRWHRVDACEIWHWYAGAALLLRILEGGRHGDIILGSDLAAGQRPQAIVNAHAWQSAKTLGAWTLVGCTVSPGFEFAGFELAPDGWEPGGD